MKINNILVLTDFSERAQKAYISAAALSRKFHARIHLVHVLEEVPPAYFFTMEGFASTLPEADRYEDMKNHLEAHAEKQAAFQGLDVETSLLSGAYSTEALRKFEKEKEIDIAVLTTHGRTGLSYALLGSFTEKVVRSLSSPVLTSRPQDKVDEAFAAANVLVPYDFSENAKAILPAVRFLSEHYGSSFAFFFVLEPLQPIYDEPAGPAFYEIVRQATEDAPKQTRERFNALKEGEFPDVNASLEISEGNPVGEIVQRARDRKPDLVLLATHGWTGIRHLLLGSVAEKVVRKAPCSVLTIRSPGVDK